VRDFARVSVRIVKGETYRARSQKSLSILLTWPQPQTSSFLSETTKGVHAFISISLS
jgi:hypothetical protein